MQQQYLTALSECFRVAAMDSTKTRSFMFADLLELSMQPRRALMYFERHKDSMLFGVDLDIRKAIEDYLQERTKQ